MDDIPKHLSPKHRESTHSIYFPDEKVRIPLELDGFISLFNVRTPTLQEINNCTTLSVTDHDTQWDPRSILFKEQEDAYESNDLILTSEAQDRVIYSMQVNPYLSETIDLAELNTKIHHKLEAISLMASTSSNRRLKVGADELSKRWAIGQFDLERKMPRFVAII